MLELSYYYKTRCVSNQILVKLVIKLSKIIDIHKEAFKDVYLTLNHFKMCRKRCFQLFKNEIVLVFLEYIDVEDLLIL